MDPTSRDRLLDGARVFGACLGELELERFEAYLSLLQLWGGKMNLTARLDTAGIVTHHFLDSLSLLPFLPPADAVTLIDVGAGAGFPALPLKICRPRLAVTLLESSHKKASFCREVARRLRLQDVRVVQGRAETLGSAPHLHGTFDWVVARALGPTEASVPLCLPFVRPGGSLVLFKGRLDPRERGVLEEAARRGGAAVEVESVTVPFLDAARSLVFLRKCST